MLQYTTSEVIPDQNTKFLDSGIPTKINPGIPENREKFRDSRKQMVLVCGPTIFCGPNKGDL